MSTSATKTTPTKAAAKRTRSARRAATETAETTSPSAAGEPSTAVDTPAPAVLTGPATHHQRLQNLDPRTLLLDTNIRSAAELDPEFLASIREHGVLMPIVAVRVESGIRVLYGQRRTLAAIEVGLDLVPVVVREDGQDTEVTRIVTQWHENQNRRGLSVADQIGAAEQLAAFGIPADQIGKQLGASTEDVTHALAAAKSPLARKAAPRYDLTLEQSAAIAEFEDDPESVKLLVLSAKEGPVRFEHQLERLRSLRAVMEKKAAAEAKLTKAKVRIITQDDARGGRVKTLVNLAAAAPSGSTYPPAITVAQHKKCPGHAAYIIVRDWAGTVETAYVCTDWETHGHHERYNSNPRPQTPAVDPETKRAERRTVITNNKNWDTATAVRQRFLKTFLARKSPDKGSAAFLAGELLLGGFEIRRAMERGSKMLCELLGYKDRGALKTAAAAATNTTDGHAQVLALAVVLAAIEESLSRDTWRDPSAAAVRYFAFLTQHGYQVSDVEQLVLPKKKTARNTAAAKAKVSDREQAADDQDTSRPQDSASAPAATDGEVAA